MTTTEQLRREVKACAEAIEDAAREGTLAEYFEDTLDVEVKVSLTGGWRGVKIALALGEPGIFFDTADGWVKGYWCSDFAEYHVCNFATDAVDEYFSDLWQCVHGY